MKFDKNLCLFCKSKLEKVNLISTCTNCSFNYSWYSLHSYLFHEFETEEFIITCLIFKPKTLRAVIRFESKNPDAEGFFFLEKGFKPEDFLLYFSKYIKLAVEEKLNDYLKKLIILQ